MFKPLLIILALLFISVYAQTQNPDLSKSFTAICDAKEYDTCLYSLVLASTSASFGYTIEVYVVVNDTVVTQAQYEIENSFSPEIVNIPVKNNEDILVYLDIISGVKVLVMFTLYDQAGGNGKVVTTSRSRHIIVNNPCEADSCRFEMKGSSGLIGWPDYLSAVVKVNGLVKATVNNTNNSTFFSVVKDDAIEYEVITESENAPIPDGVSVSIYYRFKFFKWISNSYYYPILINTECSAPYPHSPFGGFLHTVSQEQLSIFLSSIRFPPSEYVYPLTDDISNKK